MTLFSHTNFWCFNHLVLITQHALATVKGSIPVGPLIHQLGDSGLRSWLRTLPIWHDCLLFSLSWEMTWLIDHLHHRSLSVLTRVKGQLKPNRYENILTQTLCWNGLFWHSIKLCFAGLHVTSRRPCWCTKKKGPVGLHSSWPHSEKYSVCNHVTKRPCWWSIQ